MKPVRVPAGVVVPALLVVLVGLLAAFQYRWLGKVSEAEREQLRRSLAQRAQEFADDFDREISRAYRGLRLEPDALTWEDWTGFAAAVDRWRATARFPQMVRGIFLAELQDDGRTLRRYDAERRAFDSASLAQWPATLEPLRPQLAAARDGPHQAFIGALTERTQSALHGTTTIVALTVGPVNTEVPALVVPVTGSTSGRVERSNAGLTRSSAAGIGGSGTPSDDSRARSAAPARPPDAGNDLVSVRAAEQTVRTRLYLFPDPVAYVIIELDGAFLRGTVLPALVARHFPEPGAGDYRVAVLSPTGAPLFTRGVAEGASLDPEKADSVTPFFTLRLELSRDILADLGAGAQARTPGGAGSGSESIRPPAAAPGEDRVSVLFESRVASAPGAGASPETPSLPAVAGGLVRIARSGGWRVVLQHRAGSLDAAVSQVRRRNLAISFGILTVLAAGMLLIVRNARRSEQLAARQIDFVATVSHELRTPLAVIRSAAQNLSAGVVADPEKARRYGVLIDEEGRRLSDMVEQVLDYAGIGDSRRVRDARPVEVGSLISEVAAGFEPAASAAGVAVQVDTTNDGAPLPPVMVDPDALRRVVGNLVTNALKHGAAGRWVGIAVKTPRAGRVPEVLIEVSDRGGGIETADLAHIFEPFYRGRRAVEQQVHGNGLGLSLVKRIVEAHGGKVVVRSTAGAGSTFVVHLPAAAVPGTTGAEAAAAVENRSSRPDSSADAAPRGEGASDPAGPAADTKAPRP